MTSITESSQFSSWGGRSCLLGSEGATSSCAKGCLSFADIMHCTEDKQVLLPMTTDAAKYQRSTEGLGTCV